MIDLVKNFHFIRPAFLLLLPLAGFVWWLWQRHSDPLKGWRDQIDPGLLDALVVGRESASRLPVRLILTGWLVAIIAIAGPTWKLEPSPFAEDTTPLMILLKADVSMAVPDPAPSRLERGQLKISDIAKARKGQPLGIIAYAGSAHLVLPPTRDTATAARMASEISPEIMPVAGDRLDLALREADSVLTKGQQGGCILVVTDAVDTDLAAIQSWAKESSLPVQFLAITASASSERDSIDTAAKALKAQVTSLDVEGSDVAAIIRRAASTPVATQGNEGERWQEAGYWLVPLVALLVLTMFRREENKEVSA